MRMVVAILYVGWFCCVMLSADGFSKCLKTQASLVPFCFACFPPAVIPYAYMS